MKNIHILLLPILLLLVSCGLDTPTSVSPSGDELTETSLAKGPSNIDAFDMNDRLSVPKSGASGSGTVKVINGQMNLTIHARGLETDHAYEIHVVVGPKDNVNGCFCLTCFIPDEIHVFPVKSDKNGKIKFKTGLKLNRDSGEYRIDYVVIDDPEHAHAFCDGFDCLLLACAPASCVTI